MTKSEIESARAFFTSALSQAADLSARAQHSADEYGGPDTESLEKLAETAKAAETSIKTLVSQLDSLSAEWNR
jgi:hypothetical protein